LMKPPPRSSAPGPAIVSAPARQFASPFPNKARTHAVDSGTQSATHSWRLPETRDRAVWNDDVITHPDGIESQRLCRLGDRPDRLRGGHLPEMRKTNPEVHSISSSRTRLVPGAQRCLRPDTARRLASCVRHPTT